MSCSSSKSIHCSVGPIAQIAWTIVSTRCSPMRRSRSIQFEMSGGRLHRSVESGLLWAMGAPDAGHKTERPHLRGTVPCPVISPAASEMEKFSALASVNGQRRCGCVTIGYRRETIAVPCDRFETIHSGHTTKSVSPALAEHREDFLARCVRPLGKKFFRRLDDVWSGCRRRMRFKQNQRDRRGVLSLTLRHKRVNSAQSRF